MKYKLIACDLDGTLLNDDSAVTQENFKAIEKIKNTGAEFAVCTGRTFYEIPENLRSCPDVRYIIYSDGAVLYDKQYGKILYSDYIAPAVAKTVYDILDSYVTMIELYENGTPKTDAAKLNSAAYDYYNIDPLYVPVIEQTRRGYEDIRAALNDFDKVEIFNVFFKNPDDRQDCIERLNAAAELNITTSMDNNIEIMNRTVSKGNALKHLADILNVKLGEIITAGDSKNDFSTFEISGLSVAPASASYEVRQRADATACSNNEPVARFILENYLT